MEYANSNPRGFGRQLALDDLEPGERQHALLMRIWLRCRGGRTRVARGTAQHFAAADLADVGLAEVSPDDDPVALRVDLIQRRAAR